jgi:uncharacterized DUF497 family protein
MIEFDPVKDAANIKKHGISLARAADLIPAISVVDDRFDYGETRIRTYGHIDGVAYCLTFTTRGIIVRPISLRRAHSREMKRYAP